MIWMTWRSGVEGRWMSRTPALRVLTFGNCFTSLGVVFRPGLRSGRRGQERAGEGKTRKQLRVRRHDPEVQISWMQSWLMIWTSVSQRFRDGVEAFLIPENKNPNRERRRTTPIRFQSIY